MWLSPPSPGKQGSLGEGKGGFVTFGARISSVHESRFDLLEQMNPMKRDQFKTVRRAREPAYFKYLYVTTDHFLIAAANPSVGREGEVEKDCKANTGAEEEKKALRCVGRENK